jgi:hypothetical protein
MNAIISKPAMPAADDAEILALEAEFWRIEEQQRVALDLTGDHSEELSDQAWKVALSIGDLRAQTPAGLAAKLRIAAEYSHDINIGYPEGFDAPPPHMSDYLLRGVARDTERMARLDGARRPPHCATQIWVPPHS